MRQGTRVAAAFALAASWLVTGCAGNGAGLDANGQPLVPGESSGPITADFDSIQSHVFTPICTLCHAGADAPHGLRLDAADSYTLLVGVPSVEVPSILRVKPGDPDNSYVIQKLEGHAAVGARMPLGGPYLSSDVIAVIRQWITNGAPPSSATAMPAAFAMLTVAPAAGDVLSEPPALVVIGFTHELDATRIDSESVRIERSAVDGAEAPAEIVPASAMVPFANPRALVLRPLRPLNAGHYRVLMRTAAGSGVTDMAGEALRPADSGEALVTTFDVEVAP